MAGHCSKMEFVDNLIRQTAETAHRHMPWLASSKSNLLVDKRHVPKIVLLLKRRSQ